MLELQMLKINTFHFLGAQIETSIARKNPKYNQPGRANATQVEKLVHFMHKHKSIFEPTSNLISLHDDLPPSKRHALQRD